MKIARYGARDFPAYLARVVPEIQLWAETSHSFGVSATSAAEPLRMLLRTSSLIFTLSTHKSLNQMLSGFLKIAKNFSSLLPIIQWDGFGVVGQKFTPPNRINQTVHAISLSDFNDIGRISQHVSVNGFLIVDNSRPLIENENLD